jgi:hypothetical protein
MASKFMVNAAFKARLLLRPSHQRTVLFGLSTSLNAPSLADPHCRRFSAPDYTHTLLPLLPFQNPPALLRARNLLDLSIRTGSPLRPGARLWAGAQLVLYVQAPFMCQLKHADYQRLG